MNPNEYKITKIEKTVQLRLESPPPFTDECQLFLNPHSRHGTGAESLEEFLNHATPFIPVRLRRGEGLNLVNLEAIIWVHEQSPSPPMPVLKSVHLVLKGDIELDVEHGRTLPSSHARILDYLNGPERFIAFRMNGGNIFINKNKIIRSQENG